MRITRILLLVVAAAAVAGVFASTAGALAFADNPCPITPPGIIKICPEGETGKPYTLQLLGRTGTGCYGDNTVSPYVTWSIIGGTALPTGLTMDSSGLITGTPTTAGKDDFWVQMQDHSGTPFWCSDNEATQREFEITILPGLQIVQRQSTLGPAQLTVPYSLQLSANGAGSSALQWSVASGSLPAGLTLNGSTGLLSGTATTKGSYQFQVKVTDGTRSDAQTYTLLVVDPLKITSPPPTAGELGQAFQTTLTAEGGQQPYKWALASGATLPAGLTLDATTGAISGTPTAAGVSPVKVTVTDSLGLSQTIDLQIAVAKQLAIVKRALPAAKVRRAYSARLLALGGVAPRTWTIQRGSLPSGLRLNQRTGVISGKPKKAGRSTATIVVTDKLGVVSQATFSLRVIA
jgi:large repetitive protein